jgi:all-trans-retinol 13,14-reductase
MSEVITYDAVIVGGGFGGLACGKILADHGWKVIVLEKNHQIGGNLQVFSRDKVIFDTGVHYLGGLNPGENLDLFFRYLGIRDKLELAKMDEWASDKIHFGDEAIHYPIAQGYSRYIEELSKYFPEEQQSIVQFAQYIQETCAAFPLYNMRYEEPDYFNKPFFTQSIKEVLESFTSNTKLQSVWMGNSFLYAGDWDTTPFYVLALVIDSYLKSAYRCVKGSAQITKLLVAGIRERGGEVWKRAEVIDAVVLEGQLTEVLLKDGRRVKGKQFISNMHPLTTVNVFGRSHFKKAFVSRLESLTNTAAAFSVHIKFKPNSYPYLNYNIYHHKQVQGALKQNGSFDANWPHTLMVSMTLSEPNPTFAEAASLLTYLDQSACEGWQHTFNTVGEPAERPESYLHFKKECETRVLNELEHILPGISSCIESVYSSTPLTYQNYIGDPSGSMYGIQKNVAHPMATMIDPRTKIPNLLLTGQNINLHGLLGVSVSAFATCFHLIDPKPVLTKCEEIRLQVINENKCNHQ